MRCESEPLNVSAKNSSKDLVNSSIHPKWASQIIAYTISKVVKTCKQAKIICEPTLITIKYGGREIWFGLYSSNTTLTIEIRDQDFLNFGRFVFHKGKVPKFKSMISSRIKRIYGSLLERQINDVINS